MIPEYVEDSRSLIFITGFVVELRSLLVKPTNILRCRILKYFSVVTMLVLSMEIQYNFMTNSWENVLLEIDTTLRWDGIHWTF